MMESLNNLGSFFMELRELLVCSAQHTTRRASLSTFLFILLQERLLKNVTNTTSRSKSSTLAMKFPPVRYYSRLLQELDELGWNYLHNVDATFSLVQLKVK
jgi:hypothetical protein